jgi:hypothetical protein
MAILIGLLTALAGYFGPWVWHPAVALRLSADDLGEFVKFIPAVQFGALPITRELFYAPIWLAAIGIACWVGVYVRRRWVRAVIGLLLIYASIWPMPPYPFILDAYRSSEFGPAFWTSVLAALLCAAGLLFGRRLADRWQRLLWIAIGLPGASLAPLAFFQARPAIEELYRFTIGWGLAAVALGFAAAAISGFWPMRRSMKSDRRI